MAHIPFKRWANEGVNVTSEVWYVKVNRAGHQGMRQRCLAYVADCREYIYTYVVNSMTNSSYPILHNV